VSPFHLSFGVEISVGLTVRVMIRIRIQLARAGTMKCTGSTMKARVSWVKI